MTSLSTQGKTPNELLAMQAEALQEILIQQQKHTADDQAVIQRLTQVIQFQTVQIAHLDKIARAANLYFWITIISIILSVLGVAFSILFPLALLGGASNFGSLR